jgi:hypothetical protein
MMASSYVKDWPTFMQIQFVGPINRLYSYGATVVVLTFDNYEFCPGSFPFKRCITPVVCAQCRSLILVFFRSKSANAAEKNNKNSEAGVG